MTVREVETAVARPAYRDGNVLRWLAAHTASVTGDVVCFLALSWSAARAAGPSQAGLAVAAGALPRAVFMLAGGVVADRFGPRRVAAVSDATRCLVILLTAAVLVSAAPDMRLLIPLALLFGVVDAVFMPAVGAFPPRITTREQLARVQGMRGLSLRLSNAAGPAVGGVVLAAGGAGGAFTAAGALFAVSLALLLTSVSPPLPPRSPSAPPPPLPTPAPRPSPYAVLPGGVGRRAAVRPAAPAPRTAHRCDRAERDVLQRPGRPGPGAAGGRAGLGRGGHGLAGERLQRRRGGRRPVDHRAPPGSRTPVRASPPRCWSPRRPPPPSDTCRPWVPPSPSRPWPASPAVRR
nr:MFS transporter [Streptomyces sp. Tu 6176]